MTLAAACPATISPAMFGPVSAAAGWPGNSSFTISVMRRRVVCSSPFVTLTIGIHGWTQARASVRTARNPCDGMATMSTSANATASSRSAVARRVGGSAASGR